MTIYLGWLKELFKQYKDTISLLERKNVIYFNLRNVKNKTDNDADNITTANKNPEFSNKTPVWCPLVDE